MCQDELGVAAGDQECEERVVRCDEFGIGDEGGDNVSLHVVDGYDGDVPEEGEGAGEVDADPQRGGEPWALGDCQCVYGAWFGVCEVLFDGGEHFRLAGAYFLDSVGYLYWWGFLQERCFFKQFFCEDGEYFLVFSFC